MRRFSAFFIYKQQKEEQTLMTVFIDADGCPVIASATDICRQRQIPLTLICDTSHLFTSDYAAVVTVDKGSDSADLAIANMVSSGDIVITQDYGLAAMCLAKKCICLSQNGLVYDSTNIDSLLMSRHIAKKVRRSGGRLKGPHKRTAQQDEDFAVKFIEILNNTERR